MSGQGTALALIDGAAFYCSCERVFDPNLKAVPVIVLSNNGCAIARTAEAKALGIRPGGPRFNRRELCRREAVVPDATLSATRGGHGPGWRRRVGGRRKGYCVNSALRRRAPGEVQPVILHQPENEEPAPRAVRPTPVMRRYSAPLLAGTSLRDRLLACLGGLLGIALTSLIAALALRSWTLSPTLVAPMGASAVLVFAVPASPLAQPWPVIGGNVVSALVGVTAARLVPGSHLAAGLAVGGAILLMSLLRCLHPPGGAAALTAVIGGPAVLSAGYAFPFVPVGLDAVLLTLAGLAFHRVSGHSYPHRPAAAPALAESLYPEDIDRALADLGETLDVSREDLEALIRRVEHHAAKRQHR